MNLLNRWNEMWGVQDEDVYTQLYNASARAIKVPFMHPLYTFITICTPMYTIYICIYTTYTPLNTSKHL